jgi:hypothetical protein
VHTSYNSAILVYPPAAHLALCPSLIRVHFCLPCTLYVCTTISSKKKKGGSGDWLTDRTEKRKDARKASTSSTKKDGLTPEEQELADQFERSSRARMHWRKAISAAKCIARFKIAGEDAEEEDDIEFHFDDRTNMATLTAGKHGKVLSVASSTYHKKEEKMQKRALNAALGPSVSFI